MSQAVQDLLWVVNSPSFVQGPNVAMMSPLAATDVDAVALQAFLDERGPVHRVGRYFEQLVHYWLVHICGVELLGAGLQIRDGKRTIGELDFVYRDASDQVVHCEVSVKFFLHYPRAGTSDFPGPNASDNFELKTAKLFDKQLALSKVHYPLVQRRHAIVKGMVFYQGDRPAALPPRMHPDHASGSWLRAHDLGQLGDRRPLGAAVVSKPHWLAPEIDAPILAIDEAVAALQEHFVDGIGHPLMVSLRDRETSTEIERMFVVSAGWPSTGN